MKWIIALFALTVCMQNCYADDAGNQQTCANWSQAVVNNLAQQMDAQHASSSQYPMLLSDASYSHSDEGAIACVAQLRVSDPSDNTFQYMINYNIVSGQLLVYADYMGESPPPFHLYTYEDFLTHLTPDEAIKNAQKTGQSTAEKLEGMELANSEIRARPQNWVSMSLKQRGQWYCENKGVVYLAMRDIVRQLVVDPSNSTVRDENGAADTEAYEEVIRNMGFGELRITKTKYISLDTDTSQVECEATVWTKSGSGGVKVSQHQYQFGLGQDGGPYVSFDLSN